MTRKFDGASHDDSRKTKKQWLEILKLNPNVYKDLETVYTKKVKAERSQCGYLTGSFFIEGNCYNCQLFCMTMGGAEPKYKGTIRVWMLLTLEVVYAKDG